MIARLFLLFSLMSLAEIYVLIKVGSILGALSTVALILITAMVGATLVRNQGLQTAFTARSRMAKGEVPAQQMIEGLMLVICGVLLITPGFITDSFGLLLLVPSFRAAAANKFLSSFLPSMGKASGFSAGFSAHSPEDFSAGFGNDSVKKEDAHIHQGHTIEGEFEKRD